MLGLSLEFDVSCNLFDDIGCPKGKTGSEDRIESFEEIQAVNPPYEPVKLHINVNLALLPREIIIVIATFQIEPYTIIIVLIKPIVFLNGIIHQFILLFNAVCTYEASTAQNVENFLSIFHNHIILNRIHKGIFYVCVKSVLIADCKFIQIL